MRLLYIAVVATTLVALAYGATKTKCEIVKALRNQGVPYSELRDCKYTSFIKINSTKTKHSLVFIADGFVHLCVLSRSYCPCDDVSLAALSLWSYLRPKKKIPVFLLTRPTLAQTPDSAVFIATGKNKNYNALPYQIFHPTLIIFHFASFCYQKVCLVIFRS